MKKLIVSRLIPSILLISLGILVGSQGVRSIITGFQADAWQSVEGEIIVSKTRSRPRTGTSAWDYSSELDITYRYSVNGKEFKGHRVSFHDIQSEASSQKNSRRHRSIKRRYHVGKTVQVHFDPTQPENSVLELGLSGGNWGTVVFGAAFLGVGLLVLFGVLKSD